MNVIVALIFSFLVIPIRVKSKVVDAFEIHDRWTEEVALLKREMSNFLKFYTNVRIPTLQQEIMKLEDQLKAQGMFDILNQ